MYILIDRKAKEGEYIKHKVTGEIAIAKQVLPDGMVTIGEDIRPFFEYPMEVQWFLEEYVVLHEIFEGYFKPTN